jgi:hypothetical protein
MKQKVLLTDKRIKEDLLKKASSSNLYFFIIAVLLSAATYPLFLFSEELSFRISSFERTAALVTSPLLAIFFLFLSLRIALQRDSIKRGSFLVTEEALDSVGFLIILTGHSPFKKNYRSVPVLNFRRCQYTMIESTDFEKDIEKLESEIGGEFHLVFASAADNVPLLVYSKSEYERI